MTKKNLSRREFLKIATVAAGTAVVAGIAAVASKPAAVGNVLSSIFGLSAGSNQAFSGPSKMAWWYEARFGMFIHFGSYSYLGKGEWVMSTGYPRQEYQTQVSAPFNPTNFNATTIATFAKNAGMKYLVITAKHHEGFAMWDRTTASFKDYTGTTIYSLNEYTTVKFSRDILMELKNACEMQGIKFCIYYSICDWNHSSQRGFNFPVMSSMTARTNYIKDMKAELRELIAKYDPAVLWFDGDWLEYDGTPTVKKWWTKADGQDLYNYCVSLKPTLIVNERCCRSFGLGDFDCPENTVPIMVQSRQWETCRTMNQSWGYNSDDINWKDVYYIVRELATVVSRDGNYLLNIGPKGDGSMVSDSQTILSGIGNWMAIYGDSIYGTTGTPFKDSSGGSFNEPSWGRYTKKSGKLFAHVFTWPTDGELTISGITNSISKIYSMSSPGTPLSWSVSESNIVISVPTNAPDENDSVICIECVGVPTPGTPSGGATVP